MILREFQHGLLQSESLATCDEFLRAHLHEIRPLFYGLTRSELQSRRLDYEEVLFAFINSSPGREIQQGIEPPAAVIALLIFFFSLFERAGLYTDILSVANLLPHGSLRNRAEAIFEYKNITNSESDYVDRFDRIVGLIQDAWADSPEDRRLACEDLLIEYALDALLLPHVAGLDLRAEVESRFLDPAARAQYSLLDSDSINNLFTLGDDALKSEQLAVRSRIVESLHSEACELVPESLICQVAEALQGEESPAVQTFDRIPGFLDTQLARMGAIYQQRRQDARLNFESTPEDNRGYLGTYFPKTVVETWNIVSELLSIPVISSAIAQKDQIRILDVGSGTGAAVVGTLLALSDWGRCEVPVEVTSMDINQDALAKQREILDSMREQLPFSLAINLKHVPLPFDLESFVPAFSTIADKEGHRYDIITCWKCLCEFYNVSFASAQGIIRHTIQNMSRMLLPYGLCIVSDVTTSDNGYEYFAMTLNRESNEHDRSPDATMRTILPLPCARNATSCRQRACYTQRKFVLRHRLVMNDETKIAYRVFAPNSFAQTIATTFTDHPAYHVNAARRAEACYNGNKREVATRHPCGYTGFFAGRS